MPVGFPGGNGASGFGGENASAVSVRTIIAQKQDLQDYVVTNGEIECESSVDCYADIGGKIAKIYASLGDSVRKGDPIAEVDPSEPGSYYINSVVYAPISGTITSTPKEIGTTISTSSAITTIGDVNNLQIRASVPERYVSYLKNGLKAQIILEAYPQEIFEATVTKVSPVLDSSSRTKEIILLFDKVDNRINAGMFAKLTLFTVKYTGKVVIPENAIVEKSNKKYVYVVNQDGKSVSLREIQLANSVDSYVQISGVEENEIIVIEGMTSITEGSLIRIVGEKND